MRNAIPQPSRWRHRSAAIALLLLLLPLASTHAWAQIGPRTPLRIVPSATQAALADFGGSDPSSKSGPLVKVGFDLCLLYEQSRLAQNSNLAFSEMPLNPLVHTTDDARVIVDVTVEGDAAAAASQLTAIGMQVSGTAGHLVSGALPIQSIPALASSPVVRAAMPAMWTTQVGLTTSQGDSSMNSDNVRRLFNINGNGVKIGVMSDSYNHLGGANTDISTGDLPGPGNPNGFTTAINVIQDSNNSTDTDEGRGMLQLVHDVAPGAQLMFATANGGEANFATNIGKLRAAGANVEVDDVIYYAEPMFQDGVIAQAADACFAAGVPYFSSAGNQARNAYTSAFVSGGSYASGAISSAGGAPSFLGGTAHDFDPSSGVDNFQSVTIGAGGTMTVALEWDQPFASVSGGAGCQSDVDIYLLNSASNQVVAGSVSNNVGNDAVEVLGFKNTGGSAANYNLMIVLRSGAAPGTMKYVMYGAQQNEYQTNSGTVYGHCNANGAEAVAAAPYYNTPAFGVSPPTQEPFSSSGTTPVLFTTTGASTFDARAHKPGITAPDGCNTTFFGSDSDGDGFPNFFGTSAAAPHAAAVAALMLQVNSSATPTQIFNAEEASTIDMDVAGFDNNTGAGLLQAPGAVEAMSPCTLTCPGDVTVSNDAGKCGADVTFTAPTTTGLCGGVTLSNASGSFFPVGTTTVTATSAAGQSCQFKVIVNDTEKPKITCPSDITVECDSHSGVPKGDAQLTAFFAGVSATDNCTAKPKITNDAPDNFPACQTTLVTFTATDDAGNHSSCSANVKVVDTTPPVLTVSLDRTVLWPPNHKMVPINATVTVSDICDPSPTVVLTSITSNEPDNGTGDGDTVNDIQDAAYGTLDTSFELRSERSGNLTGRVYTITYTASDHCGNSTPVQVTVQVPHDHNGTAVAGQGFTDTGTTLATNTRTFAVVIPSVPYGSPGATAGYVGDTTSTAAATGAPMFNAQLVDRSHVLVGNGHGVASPLFTNLVDVNGDGAPDLVAVFSTLSVNEITAGSALDDGPIGLHYATRGGDPYLVPSLFVLGHPQLLPAIALVPSTDGNNPTGVTTASATPVTAASARPTGATAPVEPAVKVTALTGVFPNPFGDHTTVAFSLAHEGEVDLAVYNILGARVRTLRRGMFESGRYQDDWDGLDERGHRVGAGIYIVRMNAGAIVQVQKVARMH